MDFPMGERVGEGTDGDGALRYSMSASDHRNSRGSAVSRDSTSSLGGRPSTNDNLNIDNVRTRDSFGTAGKDNITSPFGIGIEQSMVGRPLCVISLDRYGFTPSLLFLLSRAEDQPHRMQPTARHFPLTYLLPHPENIPCPAPASR
jgi:hypothetical protein